MNSPTDDKRRELELLIRSAFSKHIQELERENARLKHALEFYAKMESWEPRFPNNEAMIDLDCGQIARGALGLE